MWFKEVLEELRILNNTLASIAELQRPVRDKEMKDALEAGLYHPELDELEQYWVERNERERVAKINPYFGIELTDGTRAQE